MDAKPLTAEERMALRKLAEAVTPGPWEAKPLTPGSPATKYGVYRPPRDLPLGQGGWLVAPGSVNEEMAAYIAAVPPDRVLCLLDELESAMERAGRTLLEGGAS